MKPEMHSRSHFLRWLDNNIPRQYLAAKRALVNGAELLGGFYEIPPSPNPGWIVKTTSSHGKVFLIAITVAKNIVKPSIWMTSSVPWKFWAGDQAKNTVYVGDNPELYGKLKQGDGR